jgi:hypothetical protein
MQFLELKLMSQSLQVPQRGTMQLLHKLMLSIDTPVIW